MTRLPEIIAEIGVNYYDIAKERDLTPLAAAKLMVEKAKEAGITIVKFQTYKAEKLAAENSPAYWDLNEEPTTSQKQLFSRFDKLSPVDYASIADYCNKNGVEFMTTAFDPESAENINLLVRRHKIASADITNIEMLSVIGSFRKPVLLSTGASTKEEIQMAIDVLEKSGAASITLLHCVLNYPTPLSNANLWKIRSLKKEFPETTIGYSDHTKFNIDVLLTAWFLGADVIEKHFTLNKALKGNDHYHAASPGDLRKLVKRLKHIRCFVGEEISAWYDPSEEESRRFARRGVYLTRDVHAGEELSAEDVVFLRPQREGITPLEWAKRVLRKEKYTRDMENGQLVI